MDHQVLVEYAPVIVLVIVFLIQQRLVVTPEQLEKKHREILRDIKNDYVEVNAYKVFQQHISAEIEDMKTDMKNGFDELKEMLGKKD